MERSNTPRSRNARLAAIHSLFRFIEYRVPACPDQARRIHAIPMKRSAQPLVGYLTRAEMQALLATPDLRTAAGLRDQAMLHLAFAAGLRVSELVGLRLDQFDAAAMPSLHVIGKGRRERILPLWQDTARAVRRWIALRPVSGDPQLFLNAGGRAMTRSGFEYILHKHAAIAAQAAPSIAAKRVTPHTSCATAARCTRCKPPAMCARSRSGSAMPASRPPRCTCAPIRPKSSRRSTPWARQP